MLKPIIYHALVDVHFSDLDAYGHVNSKHYMDYLITSRWVYGFERFGQSADYFIQKGIAFYVSEFSIQYRRAIVGIQKVKVESSIENATEAALQFGFRVSHANGIREYATGKIQFTCVDIKTKRKTKLPEWCLPFFYEFSAEIV